MPEMLWKLWTALISMVAALPSYMRRRTARSLTRCVASTHRAEVEEALETTLVTEAAEVAPETETAAGEDATVVGEEDAVAAAVETEVVTVGTGPDSREEERTPERGAEGIVETGEDRPQVARALLLLRSLLLAAALAAHHHLRTAEEIVRLNYFILFSHLANWAVVARG